MAYIKKAIASLIFAGILLYSLLPVIPEIPKNDFSDFTEETIPETIDMDENTLSTS